MLTRPILALAVASFGIGTTEFVIMGLLPEVAASFAVSVPRAGLLVTGYALGVVVGAPIMAVATAGLPRKSTLLALMAIFIVGNVGCALAPSYALLLAARIVTAFAHGAFFGIGAIVAGEVAPAGRRGQAVALMFTGLTLANVLGVPFGTALGQAAGWRAAFMAVVLIGLAAWIAIAAYVPRGVEPPRSRIVAEFRALGRWPVLLPMLVSCVSSVSLFSVFTYITPLLERQVGFSPHGVTGALLAVGVGLTLGNLIGGRLADGNLLGAIQWGFVGLIAVLLVMALVSHAEPSVARYARPALVRDARWAMIVVLTLWGALAFALVSPLQVWVVHAAVDAPNLASILNQGAFNLGNALGAGLGGLALTAGLGYAALPLLGAAVAAGGLLLALRGRASRDAAVAPAERVTAC